MGKKLAFKATALEYFEALIPRQRAVTLVHLHHLLEGKLTATPPGFLQLFEHRLFTLLCPVRDGHSIQNLIRIEGCFEVPEGKRIAVPCIERVSIMRGRDVISMSSVLRRQANVPVLYVDAEWLERQFEDPAIRDIHKNEPCATKTDMTRQGFVRERFYGSLDQIRLYAKHSPAFRHTLPFQTAHGLKEVRQLHTFDTGGRIKCAPGELERLLRGFGAVQKPLIAVNFIDRLDPYSLAQTGLMNLLMVNVKYQYPDLNIHIVDIDIRNEQGEFIYGSTLDWYGGDKATPFTMLLYRPKEFKGEGVASLGVGLLQRVDFDLLEGCRGEITRQKESVFRANRDRIIHEAFRAGSTMAETTVIEVKDYMGFEPDEREAAMANLRKESLVVRVNGSRKVDFRKVLRVCANLSQRGMPFTTIVLDDGDEDKVGIMTRFLSEEADIGDAGDIEDMAWMLYEVCILGPGLWEEEAKNLPSSPFMVQGHISGLQDAIR